MNASNVENLTKVRGGHVHNRVECRCRRHDSGHSLSCAMKASSGKSLHVVHAAGVLARGTTTTTMWAHVGYCRRADAKRKSAPIAVVEHKVIKWRIAFTVDKHTTTTTTTKKESLCAFLRVYTLISIL